MSLDPALLTQAKRAFNRAAKRPCCVVPAVPILFFGDLKAYRASPLRVLTVGLNPSLHEFPAVEPFRRFRLKKTASTWSRPFTLTQCPPIFGPTRIAGGLAPLSHCSTAWERATTRAAHQRASTRISALPSRRIRRGVDSTMPTRMHLPTTVSGSGTCF